VSQEVFFIVTVVDVVWLGAMSVGTLWEMNWAWRPFIQFLNMVAALIQPEFAPWLSVTRIHTWYV
jgi:hypothetical protein